MQNRQIAGNSLESLIPSMHSNIAYGRANSPGYKNIFICFYGKNSKNWTIRSQVPTGNCKLQFLRECSSETKCRLAFRSI